MIKGIVYADNQMTTSQQKCMESMKAVGFDDVRGYSSGWWHAWEHIDTFEWLNKEVLSSDRGCGYWLWKPWSIAHAMKDMKDGDILNYSHAGHEWISGPRHIIDVMDQDIFLFSNGHQHVYWCKGDVMEAICGRQPESQQQTQASVIFIRINDFTRRFVKEWLLWCQMPGFIDDSPSLLPNHPGFQEHRHDQAILCCMAIKYGIKLHYWADAMWYSTQRHRWPGDDYPLMFKHHRRRNNEW